MYHVFAYAHDIKRTKHTAKHATTYTKHTGHAAKRITKRTTNHTKRVDAPTSQIYKRLRTRVDGLNPTTRGRSACPDLQSTHADALNYQSCKSYVPTYTLWNSNSQDP